MHRILCALVLLISSVSPPRAADDTPAFETMTEPKLYPGDLTLTDKGIEAGKLMIALELKAEQVKAAALYEDSGLLVVVTPTADVRYYEKRKDGWGYASNATLPNSILSNVQFTRAPGLLYLTVIDRTKQRDFDRKKGPPPEPVTHRMIRSSKQQMLYPMGSAAGAPGPASANIYWIHSSRTKILVSPEPKKALELVLPERIGEGIESAPYASAVFFFDGKGYLAQTKTGWAQYDTDGKLVRWYKNARNEKWTGVTYSDGRFRLHYIEGAMGNQTYSLREKDGTVNPDLNPF